MYADDTTLIARNKIKELAEVDIQENLNKVSGWLDANNLILNREKTTTMFFGLRDLTKEEGGISAKFLGVRLDPTLSWLDHSSELCMRLACDIFALRRLCGVVSQNVVRTAYFGLFHAKITYGLIVWGSASPSKDVFILQKRAVRIIAGVHYKTHCKPWFVHLKILTLYSAFILQNLLFIKDQPDLVHNNDVHSYNTRIRHDLQLPYVRLSKSMKKPSVLAIRLFNKLPLAIRDMNIIKFKTVVIRFLLANAFYSIDEYLTKKLTCNDFV